MPQIDVEQIAQNFNSLTTFSAYIWQTSVVQYRKGVPIRGAVSVADLILVLSIFAVGAGCGYYVRSLISKKRRELFLASRQQKHFRRTKSPARAGVDFTSTSLPSPDKI
jgi:hypothetical protein